MTIAVPLIRPLIPDTSLAWWKRFNFKWLLQRAPMVFFASVSAFGVGGYIGQSAEITSWGWLGAIIQILGGMSFDVGFLGVIALADQQLTQSKSSSILYWILNFGAAILAALFNTLYYSGGTYAGITPESLTHGTPFAIFGLLYALYYHEQTKTKISQEIEAQAKEDKKREEKEQYEKDNPFACECGKRFSTPTGMYNHHRSCKIHKSQNQ